MGWGPEKGCGAGFIGRALEEAQVWVGGRRTGVGQGLGFEGCDV